MASDAEVIRDLTRAKVAFQLRAVAAAIGVNVRDARPVTTTCPICEAANPCPLHSFSEQCDHRRAVGAAPHCRWCRELVIRGLPCTCERAQEEARRVRAGS